MYQPEQYGQSPGPGPDPDWEELAQFQPEAMPDQQSDIRLLPHEIHESAFGGQVVVERAQALDDHGQPLTDHPPIYFGGGYSKRPDDTSYIIQLARTGREAFGLTYTGERDQDRLFVAAADWQPGDPMELRSRAAMLRANRFRHDDHLDDFSASSYKMKEAATLLSVLADRQEDPSEARAKEPIDAIFQSADALTGTLAMYAEPERFNNVWLAYPSGVAGMNRPSDFSYLNLLRRKPSLDEDNDIRQLAADAVDPAIGGTPMHTNDQLATGSAVMYSNHAPLLHAIGSRPDAPGITLVAGLHDGLFGPERLLGSLRSSRDVSGIVVTETGHTIGYRQDVLEHILEHSPDSFDRDAPLTSRLILPSGISAKRADRLFDLADAVDQRTQQH